MPVSDMHYSYVIMGSVAFQITSSPLFTQPFIHTQINENIKTPRHWPLCGNSLVTSEFPPQRASKTENVSLWWHHHGHVNVMVNPSLPYDRCVASVANCHMRNRLTLTVVRLFLVIDADIMFTTCRPWTKIVSYQLISLINPQIPLPYAIGPIWPLLCIDMS